MNRFLTITIFSLLALYASLTCQAQETTTPLPAPKWVSDKGFWVVENNIHQRRDYTIRFYNNDKQEIYKETVTGIKLQLHRRKTLMQLKSVLETAALAWESKQPVAENGKLLFAAIQKEK